MMESNASEESRTRTPVGSNPVGLEPAMGWANHKQAEAITS
jgi:hypothetical protein